MTYRPLFSLAFIIVLVGSLLLKLPSFTHVTAATASGILPEVSTILEQRDFRVSESAPDNDLRWISGTAGSCRVRIAAVAPQGWHQSLIAQVASGSRLFYLFEGKIYTEQPVLRTRVYHYGSRLKRYLGLNPKDAPVLAVVIAPSCENAPMKELAALLGS